jgi:hypothetical protein
MQKTRSNRPLTQFACGCLDLFLSLQAYETNRSRGDTAVKCFSTKRTKRFQVFVREEQIMEIISFEGEPVEVKVSTGGLLDINGESSDSIKERLNGLLHALGYYKVLPTDVRIFRDNTEEIFFIGRGDQKIPVGLLYAHEVTIKADPKVLEMIPDEEFVNA